MEDNNTNYFVRTLIVFVCIGIGTLIAYNFFKSEPIGEINSGLIILITFLIVLVLSESFDNFSIGRLMTLNRRIEKKERKNIELERKNSELLNQIISITNNQNQSQNLTSVYGDYYADMKKGSQSKEIDQNVVKELLDSIEDTPLIKEQVDLIKEDLDQRKLPYDSPTDEILIKFLAGTQIALQFEVTHNLIFGSQLTLLKELNSIKPEGLPEKDIHSYVSKVFKQFPNAYKDWGYENYLNFLYSHILILKSEQGKIHITKRGVEFLAWMIRNSKREDNPL
ncbi:hypothetical protein OQ279_06545 [Salinimicrobium sp. MT39]|uniref:Uncharacterized protein n=1 Tax=Salinimicrobium profundisediminis TaxID=2994553 RepID=A0A9X3CW28_9FLAO|nr:hypothetical protein [Salinimicrobium profundisediminis]MCX2837808.1 hypothetical protein [Salinimicrobium profundisediminis]